MTTAIDAYELLPAVVRLRDVENGEPLKALLGAVSEQAELVRADIDGLWDDLFIETCADWVVPYVGDLIGWTPLHDIGFGLRADVAHTISYRRRKGTLAMLGQLAHDVTGWGAHAVAFFEVLGWTQHLSHPRRVEEPGLSQHGPHHPGGYTRVGYVNVRDIDACDRIDGAFDITAHTVDVRPISTVEGWHNIRKIGFFLWRLGSYPLERVTPVAADGTGRHFSFSPLGQPAPLFCRPPDAGPARPGLTQEDEVPGPIRPLDFYAHPERYWGRSFAIRVNGAAFGGPVICKRLDATWDDPPPGALAIDVSRGRMAFGTAPAAGSVDVDFAYGFAADIGGGPYARERRRLSAPGIDFDADDPDLLETPELADQVLEVRPGTAVPDPGTALGTSGWRGTVRPLSLVRVADSGTYPLGGAGLTIQAPAADLRLTVAAANRRRPLFVGDITVTGLAIARLVLDGLVIAGTLTVHADVAELRLANCTLVPGRALRADGLPANPSAHSVVYGPPSESPDGRTLVLLRTIAGPLRLPAERHHLTIADSVVQHPEAGGFAIAASNAGAPGPEATVLRSTILGGTSVRAVTLGSNSIFAAGPLVAERRQQGCLRYSWFERTGSATPRRYRCQPDLLREAAQGGDQDAAERRARPRFRSTRYGRPDYIQLALDCAPEIAEGAADGAEMGALCHLRQPQRASNLRVRLEEYLPFGLEPGLIYVT
jgi:hypothetical protein